MTKHEVVSSVETPEGAREIPPKVPGTEAPKAERPAWLPEKFATPEDFAKSYGELEKKLGESKPAEAPKEEPKPAEVPKIEAQKTEPFIQKFAAEFEKEGKLSEASYKELAEKHGLDQETVDAYIEGRRAKAEKEANAVFDAVGGQEVWTNMVQWASQSMPRDEVEKINALLANGGSDALIAARSLQAAFANSNGLEPQQLTADGLSVLDRSVFESAEQVRQAMADPRYKTDEAYRRKVAAKLHRSKNIPV
ncbi:MAG: hypothetical protein H6590_06205 [Flavobacteriales bacterium]|nr:hypothetical protein [Flavobacteriales bacterium]